MSPLRVLMVEDSPGDARLTLEFLGRPGPGSFEVRHQERLAGALAALSLETFDAILLDLGLPDSSGLPTLRRMVEAAPDLPVVVSTGRVEEEMAIEALRLGAQDYIVKDGGNGELLPRILRYAVERKSAESRMRQSAAQYLQLFDHHPVPMWVYDRRSLAFLAVNDAAVAHYGWSRAEFLALRVPDVLAPEERGRLAAALVAERRGQPLPLGAGGIWAHVRKDGSRFEVEGASSAILFAGRDARLILAADVTERRRLAVRLIETQKLEATAQLAGGIAHDFNNLLTAILGHGELLQATLPPGGQGALACEQIQLAAQGAANLTRQLLTFSRKQEVSLERLDLNREIRLVEDLLRPLLGETVERVVQEAPGVGSIFADHRQIEQVLLNLALNARDAMPKGGRLTFETSNLEVDAELAERYPGLHPGSYVRLCVSDTGEGIDEVTLPHIFEPFFTTKPVGQGTGLGLATVHGIVSQCGGHIVAYSEVGRGTTFQILLPRVDGAAKRTVVAPAVAPIGGAETLLLVEDLEQLRRLIGAFLGPAGYQVIEARDSEHALEIARHDPRPIHGLITDVVMPHRSGPELAAELRRVRGGIKTLFLSGYTPEAVRQHGPFDVQRHFLQKPFSRNALLAKLREVLDEAPEEGGAEEGDSPAGSVK